ncbi:Ferric/cupric reductase transmembrane component 2 [Yarrowia sp. C11]|nr:Ferric/cupric reductase transmembrane component 2 [Yarrowia sp. C11]
MKISTVLVTAVSLSAVSAKTYRRQDSLNNKPYWAALGCDHLIGGHYKFDFPKFDGDDVKTRKQIMEEYCKVMPFIQSKLLCYKGAIDPDHYHTQVRKQIIQTCPNYLTLEMTDEWLENATKIAVEPEDPLKTLYLPVPFDREHWEEEYEEVKPHYIALDYASYYGVALLAYWALVFLIGTIINFSQHALFSVYKKVGFQSFRKYVSLPALFGYKHSQPMGWDPLKMASPTRIQSLVVLGYLIMAFVLCFPSYPFNDDYEEAGTWGTQLEAFVADRTGIMSFTQAPIVFLFAGRNNLLMWLTGWSFDTFNVYHRWTSRVMMVYAIIHSCIWTWMCRDNLAVDAAELYWVLGTVATIAGSLMLLQAMHVFRSRWYEIFLVLHIVFGILFVVGLWYHCWTIGWMQWVWATIAVWGFDRVLRVARIAYCGGILSADFTLVDKDQLIIKAEVPYSRLWSVYPGAHVYIYFLSGNKFWESHPFTIYQSPEATQNGKMTLLIKAKDGLTFDLVSRLVAAGGSRPMKMLIEGPYGSSHPVGKYDSSIYIAGGIGITATYAYAQKVVASSVSKSIIFTWVVRGDSCLEWFGDELEYLLSDPRVRVNLFITKVKDEQLGMVVSEQLDQASESKSQEKLSITSSNRENLNIQHCRPLMAELLPEYLNESPGTTAIVVCGPPVMNDDVRQALCANIESKTDRVDYFEESFSW